MKVGDVEFDIRITRKERVVTTGREYKLLADSGNPGDGGAVYGYVTHDKEPNRGNRNVSPISQRPESC